MSQIISVRKLIGKEATLSNPSGMYYSKEENTITICDLNGHRVLQFQRDSNEMIDLESNAANEQGLYSPLAITSDGEDNFYVSDARNNSVYVFCKKDHRWREVFIQLPNQEQINLPGSLTMSANGDLFLADFLNNRICRWNRTDQATILTEISCEKPYGIYQYGIDLYVTDNGGATILKYDINQKTCETILTDYAAIAVTCDPVGNLYFSQNRTLYLWHKDSKKVELLLDTKIWKQYGLERLCHIGAIVVIDEKTIVFSDTIQNCIYELTIS